MILRDEQQPATVGADNDGCLVKLGRIIIIVSCIVLITIALVSIVLVAYYGGKHRSQLYAYLECIYIVLQIVIGFYAALYRSKDAMFVFSVTCALNTIVLLVALLVKVYGEQPMDSEMRLQVHHRKIEASVVKPENTSHACNQFQSSSTCCKNRQLCVDENTIAGKDRLVRTLLWFLSAFNLVLTVISALISIQITTPSLMLGQPVYSYTKSRTPMKNLSPPALGLKGSEVAIGEVDANLPATVNRKLHTPAGYRTQPVHLISQDSHKYNPKLQQSAAKSPAKTSTPKAPNVLVQKQRSPEKLAEYTVESIKAATTRVE